MDSSLFVINQGGWPLRGAAGSSEQRVSLGLLFYSPHSSLYTHKLPKSLFYDPMKCLYA